MRFMKSLCDKQSSTIDGDKHEILPSYYCYSWLLDFYVIFNFTNIIINSLFLNFRIVDYSTMRLNKSILTIYLNSSLLSETNNHT